MPPSASTLLGNLLNAFIFTFSGSYARTIPEALDLLQILATIELIVTFLAYGLTKANWIAGLLWKLLGFAFLAWILSNWGLLATTLRDGFIQAGLFVGDNVLSVGDITDPGNIIEFGFSVTALMTGKLANLNLLTNGHIIIFGGLACFLIVLAYTVIAAHLFKALLEYYITAACLIFLVPFLAHEKTAPFGERVFGTCIAHAVRLLIMAALLSCALPILYTYKLPNDPNLADVSRLLSASLVMFILFLSAPALATGLITGVPVLNFGHLLHGASSAVQTGAALGAVGAAASVAVGAALRGAVSGASALRSAAHLGAEAFRATEQTGGIGSHLGSISGGLEGVGQYAISSLTSGFRAAVQSGRASAMRNTTRNTP